jgi:hypothetical protein
LSKPLGGIPARVDLAAVRDHCDEVVGELTPQCFAHKATTGIEPV